MTIDPAITADTRLPRYQQLVDHLRAILAAGDLRPGDKLSSESELALAHNVSVGTARQAISVLVNEGIMVREQGRGTFVQRPSFTTSLARFFRMEGADGSLMRPVGRVIAVRKRKGDAVTCKHLALPTGSPIIFIERQRIVDDQAVLLEDIRLDADRFAPLLTIEPNAYPDLIYPFYEETCGATIASARETISVAKADEGVSALGLPAGEPTIIIERLARGFDGAPLEWRTSTGRADAFRYSVELH